MSQNETKELKVQVYIDQKPYYSPNPTTGEALYKLGDLQPHYELFREVCGDKEDEPILNNSEKIYLKKDEHFHSRPSVVTVIVNGRKKEVKERTLSFDEIVGIAFDPVPTGPNIMFTITYKHGPHANPEGSLQEGGTIKIKEGIIIDVTPTDKS